jgi:Glycosyl transferase family 2
VPPPTDPLISIAVRIKYPPDRLLAFLLSMQRQRHGRWEVVAVTDGPNPDAERVVSSLPDPRVRLIQTPESRGRWGHPYRQLGLDACTGDYIGMSNDDNWYTPGYLEQMLLALQTEGAGLALCDMLHSYTGWGVVAAAPVKGVADLGCWIARGELVRQERWPGNDFESDGVFIERLAARAGKVALVHRPLFVHN